MIETNPLTVLKNAYRNVEVSQKRFLFLKWCKVSYDYGANRYSFTCFKVLSEVELYRMISEKNQANIHYRTRGQPHQVVEYHWGSNVKTVETIKDGYKTNHAVLSDSSPTKFFTKESPKKKKR